VSDNHLPADDSADAQGPVQTDANTAVIPPAPFAGVESTPSSSGADPRRPRPRVRSGAIVWGLLVSSFAVLVLAIVTSPANAAAFSDWASRLGVGGAILLGVIALGAFILIMALLSVIRREQRKRAARAV
jgi:hypothetical protein